MKEPDGYLGWPKEAGASTDAMPDFVTDNQLGEAMAFRPIVLMAATIRKTPALHQYAGKAEQYITLAEQLRELQVSEEWIHEIVRRQILHNQAVFTKRAFEEPETVKNELLSAVRAVLPEGYDVETHFTPRYRPWRQRIAFVPDADLFKGISSGKASVVTDEIDRFTEKGILLKSGKMLETDIIVTATGFNLASMGDIAARGADEA